MCYGLIAEDGACQEMKIAEYYAARGKLTNLDRIRSGNGHTALTYALMTGQLDIVEHCLR